MVFKIKSAEAEQVIESAEVRMFPYPHCIFVTILQLTQLNLRATLPEMVRIECDLWPIRLTLISIIEKYVIAKMKIQQIFNRLLKREWKALLYNSPIFNPEDELKSQVSQNFNCWEAIHNKISQSYGHFPSGKFVLVFLLYFSMS